MNYKFLLAIFALILTLINTSQTFQVDQLGLSLSQLSNTAYARTEVEPTQKKYLEIVEFSTEPYDTCVEIPNFDIGIKYNCYVHIYTHSCIEDSIDGDYNCQEGVFRSSPFSCEDSGETCYP